jgi:hypothetical protein
MYKVLSAESCSGGDTAASDSISQSKSPVKNPKSSFRESFISSVNTEVEQQFSGWGVTL